MGDLTPLGRSRVAFTALICALYLVASDRIMVTGDPSLLFFLTPFIAVAGVGHAPAHEAMVRAAISVAALVTSAILASLAHGRNVPDYSDISAFVTGITGIFALNLVILFFSSKLIEKAWPESDHWTH
ncbi:MAG: hypothetical protein ACU0GG_02470 [Paracoccaceae bacterium]